MILCLFLVVFILLALSLVHLVPILLIVFLLFLYLLLLPPFVVFLVLLEESIRKREKPTTAAQKARDNHAKPSTIQMKLRSFMRSDNNIDVEMFQNEIYNVTRVLTVIGREMTIFMNAFVAACCEGFECFTISHLPSNEGEAQAWVQDVFRFMTGKKGKCEKNKYDAPWREETGKKDDERPLNYLEYFFDRKRKKIVISSRLGLNRKQKIGVCKNLPEKCIPYWPTLLSLFFFFPLFS